MGNGIVDPPLPTEEEIIGKWMEYIAPLSLLERFALVGFLLNRDREIEFFDVDRISLDKTAILSNENCKAVEEWATTNFRKLLTWYCDFRQTLVGEFVIEGARVIVPKIAAAIGAPINFACTLFGVLLKLTVNEWCKIYGIERINKEEGFYCIKKNGFLSFFWSNPSEYHGNFDLVITPEIDKTIKEEFREPMVRIRVPGDTRGTFHPTDGLQVVNIIYASDIKVDSHSYKLNEKPEKKIQTLVSNPPNNVVTFIA